MDEKKMQPQQQEQKPQQEEVYLMEDRDGFMVRVPASKLESWKKAQQEPPRPLNKAEQQVRDMILQRIFGDKK